MRQYTFDVEDDSDNENSDEEWDQENPNDVTYPKQDVPWHSHRGYDVHGKLEKDMLDSLLDKFPRFMIRNHVVRTSRHTFNYEVDFLVGNEVVIETKGSVSDYGGIDKGEEFMENHGDDFFYIVVGASEDTQEIPCHKWFPSRNIDDAAEYVNYVMYNIEMARNWDLLKKIQNKKETQLQLSEFNKL